MNNDLLGKRFSARGRHVRWACAATAGFLLAGCASTGQEVQGFDAVTLAPGQTGTCESRPCRVYFQMPPGTGTYEVTGTETSLGRYPAGEKVLLGGFWQSFAIKVKGLDAPTAYVYIPRTD